MSEVRHFNGLSDLRMLEQENLRVGTLLEVIGARLTVDAIVDEPIWSRSVLTSTGIYRGFGSISNIGPKGGRSVLVVAHGGSHYLEREVQEARSLGFMPVPTFEFACLLHARGNGQVFVYEDTGFRDTGVLYQPVKESSLDHFVESLLPDVYAYWEKCRSTVGRWGGVKLEYFLEGDPSGCLLRCLPHCAYSFGIHPFYYPTDLGGEQVTVLALE